MRTKKILAKNSGKRLQRRFRQYIEVCDNYNYRLRVANYNDDYYQLSLATSIFDYHWDRYAIDTNVESYPL